MLDTNENVLTRISENNNFEMTCPLPGEGAQELRVLGGVRGKDIGAEDARCETRAEAPVEARKRLGARTPPERG